MKQCTILKTNYEIKKYIPKEQYISLEEMQQIVGGYIEHVCIPEMEENGFTVFANEDGFNLNLPYNHLANMHLNIILFGDVLVVPNNLLEPEDTK